MAYFWKVYDCFKRTIICEGLFFFLLLKSTSYNEKKMLEQ
jgi:hypothetical protein